MVDYSHLANIIKSDRNYSLTYIAFFSLIVIIFMFGKLENDKASKLSYIKVLTLVLAIYICSAFSLSGTLDNRINNAFRNRAINKVHRLGLDENSLIFNVSSLENLMYYGYRKVNGDEPSRYYVIGFVNKVLSDYYSNRTIELGDYSKFVSIDDIKLRR